VAQGIEGHLRLSFIHITPYAHVLNACAPSAPLRPPCNLAARSVDAAAGRVAGSGEVDIALLRAPGRSTPGLRFERLSGEDIVIALPSEPLRGAGAVDLLDAGR
jgi:hypothetical protein